MSLNGENTQTGMPDLIEFETERLVLRQWLPEDREPFAALNADPQVMAFLPAPLTRMESDGLADRCETALRQRGWGLWAAQRKDSQAFIGFVGLNTPSTELPFTPCVEVAWRLAGSHWGNGFATEAARGALLVAWERLGLDDIVSFTTVGNERSRAVMQRLGMWEAGTFEHPLLLPGHPLRPHCLYRLRQAERRC